MDWFIPISQVIRKPGKVKRMSISRNTGVSHVLPDGKIRGLDIRQIKRTNKKWIQRPTKFGQMCSCFVVWKHFSLIVSGPEDFFSRSALMVTFLFFSRSTSQQQKAVPSNHEQQLIWVLKNEGEIHLCYLSKWQEW